MRSFAIAAILGFVSAERVHDFFAERNLICNLCEQVVGLGADKAHEEIENLYSMYPKLEQKIAAWNGRYDMIDWTDAKKTCTNLQLCADDSVMTMLREEMPLNLHRHIEVVNSNPNSNWVAGFNDKFEGASKKEVQRLMGTVVDEDWTYKAHVKETVSADLPDTFDARTAWPECESVINHVRDQSNCGSCWAHGTTEAFNDRLCIKSGGKFLNLLSVSDTTGCCNGVQCQSFGCNGGQVGTPWSWFDRTGVVTGGDFGDNTLCYDYTMPQCAHHVESTTLAVCDDVVQVEPKCGKSCPTNASIDYTADKQKAQSSYNVRSVDSIKTELVTYGSVTAAFTVYEDFPTYKSGVYSHQTGEALGGHAIKVIGYGTEGGEDYWLCVNSWNNTWGDMGTFKIKMGDCGINNQMHAGLV